MFNLEFGFVGDAVDMLMVQKSHSQPPFGCIKPVVNHGINYLPQLVSRISAINSILRIGIPCDETHHQTFSMGEYVWNLFQASYANPS